MERHTLRLKIAGEEYPVITEEDAKYMEELAHDIDMKMATILKNGRLSTTGIFIPYSTAVESTLASSAPTTEDTYTLLCSLSPNHESSISTSVGGYTMSSMGVAMAIIVSRPRFETTAENTQMTVTNTP